MRRTKISIIVNLTDEEYISMVGKDTLDAIISLLTACKENISLRKLCVNIDADV